MLNMQFIKLGLISVLGFFLLLMGLSLLIPSNQRVSRAINIGAPHARVLAAVEDLRAWESWNHFTSQSGLTNRRLSTPSMGSGAFLNADQMKLTVTASRPDSMAMDWNQVDGRSFRGGFNFLQLRPDSLTVQWWFDFHLRWYPWEKLSSLVYDRQMGPVMEESLSELKRLMENSP
jgi:hypothetical protein